MTTPEITGVEENTNRELGFCFLELMGHRKLAGLLTEETVAGFGFLRIDVFTGAETAARATQFYSPSAVYAITPTTEETARRFAARAIPQPASRWELPAGDDDESF